MPEHMLKVKNGPHGTTDEFLNENRRHKKQMMAIPGMTEKRYKRLKREMRKAQEKREYSTGLVKVKPL